MREPGGHGHLGHAYPVGRELWTTCRIVEQGAAALQGCQRLVPGGLRRRVQPQELLGTTGAPGQQLQGEAGQVGLADFGWAVLYQLSMLVFAAVDEGEPATNADKAYALAKDFACPVCQGQSVAESDVVVARNIRREIRIWVDEGRSDAFIREQLVANFGEDIDYTPSASGITSLVWILPVVAGAVAIGGLVVVFRRWADEPDLEASADDEAIVAAARDRR